MFRLAAIVGRVSISVVYLSRKDVSAKPAPQRDPPDAPTLPMSVAAASGFAAATSHGWRAGHCGTTVNGQGNACARLDAKGSWASASRESCLSRCVRCEHCQFISYSDRFQDCSWYRTCKPKKLEATSGTGHETRRVRDGAGNLTLSIQTQTQTQTQTPRPTPTPTPTLTKVVRCCATWRARCAIGAPRVEQRRTSASPPRGAAGSSFSRRE